MQVTIVYMGISKTGVNAINGKPRFRSSAQLSGYLPDAQAVGILRDQLANPRKTQKGRALAPAWHQVGMLDRGDYIVSHEVQ